MVTVVSQILFIYILTIRLFKGINENTLQIIYLFAQMRKT
jgi:hypothetical protein